jgi:hypothetical protein
LIKVRHAGGESATLVVKGARGAAAVWTGRTDLHGDPGERVADGIELTDWNGDGNVDVVVGTYDERVRVCGEARTLLQPRLLDPQSASLRTVGPRRRTAPSTTWNAVDGAPSGVGPTPVVHGLRRRCER